MPNWPDHHIGADKKQRCGWAGTDPLYISYHDKEWGVPVTDDRTLFEFLVLEGAQAGLSWITILKKRPAYRKAFAGFDPRKVAKFDAKKEAALLKDAGIVRNKLKIKSAISNAKAFVKVQQEFGSFAKYAWGFVDNQSKVNHWKLMGHVPAMDAVSDAWSKDLKKRGFNFVGSTILYAHMQATGMVNDHVAGCFRQKQIKAFKFKG
jgi:DNA-3-methyladenine glycosylase I